MTYRASRGLASQSECERGQHRNSCHVRYGFTTPFERVLLVWNAAQDVRLLKHVRTSVAT